MIAAGFDAASYLGGVHPWTYDLYRAASFVLIVGAAVALLAAFTGYLDRRTSERGTQARRTVNAHALVMSAVIVLMLANLALRYFVWWNEVAATPALVGLSIASAVLAFIGSEIGGSLVFDLGYSVENAGDHPAWHRSEHDVMPGTPTPPPAEVRYPYAV